MKELSGAEQTPAPADRREEFRVRHRAAVFVEVDSREPDSGDATALVLSQVLDLSANGIRLLIDRPVPEDALLNLMVKFAGGAKPLKLVGEVRWQEQEAEAWLVGFSLYESAQTDIADWKEWVSEMLL